MDDCKAHYNWLHSRTRLVVEQAFGLWKNKFRIFKKPHEFKSPSTMALIIETTTVLHNWIIDNEPSTDEPPQRDWMHLGGNVLYSYEKYVVDSSLAKKAREGVMHYLYEHF